MVKCLSLSSDSGYSQLGFLQRRKGPTCGQAHRHRDVQVQKRPDAELAVAVVPPAPQAAVAGRCARVLDSGGDGSHGVACRGAIASAWYGPLMDSRHSALW